MSLIGKLPVIDVRAPVEFAQGHIPGACNLPLFLDQERAEVGTTYKNQGREPAILKGLEIVGPKMRTLVEKAKEIVQAKSDPIPVRPQVLLHCWRGGMRSRSVAWLLEQADFDVQVLEGGYKSYRRTIHRIFETPFKLVVLSGLTGAGKTQNLHALAIAGEQVVDLEGLANHRGSAFGGIGLPAQPTVEQFENLLGEQLRRLDLSRRIWVEDEGKKIGRCVVPTPFFEQLRAAPAVFLDVPREVRARLSAELYGELDKPEIETAITNIRKRLGGQNANLAIEQLRNNDMSACTDTLLAYYDKTYSFSKEKMSRQVTIDLPTADPLSVQTLIELKRLAECSIE